MKEDEWMTEWFKRPSSESLVLRNFKIKNEQWTEAAMTVKDKEQPKTGAIKQNLKCIGGLSGIDEDVEENLVSPDKKNEIKK